MPEASKNYDYNPKRPARCLMVVKKRRDKTIDQKPSDIKSKTILSKMMRNFCLPLMPCHALVLHPVERGMHAARLDCSVAVSSLEKVYPTMHRQKTS
jgi:hypothetical protein